MLTISRFHLRRTALRILSPSTSFLSKPRSITTATPSALRVPRQSATSLFQRRWATGEAEAKEEVPISELQPTAQEEVENAIHSDNAADSTPPIETEAGGDPENLRTESVTEAEPGTVESAIKSASQTAANAASAVGEAARSAASAFGGRGFAPRSTSARNQTIGEPKPTIYVGNLFFDVTENDLVKELARFGTITRCRLMRDSRGLSKG